MTLLYRLIPDPQTRIINHGRSVRQVQSFDFWPGKAVGLLVKEREHQSVARDDLLDLTIERVAHRRRWFRTPSFDEAVNLGRAAESSDISFLGV